jgi:hypothetical protein
MNIWTSENIMKYWDGTSATAKGEWTTRNGENAISIQPNNFHQNNASIQIFKDEFLPNTQYAISLYMDADDVVHNNNNVGAGMSVVYTDGTVKELVCVGNKTEPKGWQHKFLITDASKSVSHMTSYYYTSIPVYYRWDSHVIPVDTPSVNKTGVFNVESLISLYNTEDSAEISRSGTISANTFYEF